MNRMIALLIGAALAWAPTATSADDLVVAPHQISVARPVQYVVQSPVIYESYRPVVTYSAPATVVPTTVYYPGEVVTTYYSPPVYYSYRPVVTYYSSPAVVYPPGVYSVARPVIVRPKVYVPGQPVRNFLRAVTP